VQIRHLQTVIGEHMKVARVPFDRFQSYLTPVSGLARLSLAAMTFQPIVRPIPCALAPRGLNEQKSPASHSMRVCTMRASTVEWACQFGTTVVVAATSGNRART
jgi:hypothetical protein